MTRLGPLLSPILIGRDDLLDLADGRLRDAAAGHGQFLLLAGEAGIGKSRLMAAFERKAHLAGFRSAAGLLAPQDRDVPAALLLDMARSMTHVSPFADLGRDLLQLADATVAAAQPKRRALVLQAVDLIAAGLDGPTLLSFDDLQWADDLSLEILTELARASRDRPLLLVGAYRTDEVAPGSLLREWRSRLLTQRTAEEARLAPLTLEQTALMTTLILATGLPAPRDVVAAVYERTDGVPLHIEELLGALTDDERSDSRAIRHAAVPDTLEDAILQRVGRLSPEAQAVARSGAVIGRCFVPAVLAGIMDVPTEALDGPLRELVDQHVIDPPGLRGLYDFRHQLLRDALYRALPGAERRRLHARAGEFGKELEGASEIHASLHYERAGMTAQAYRSALQGAQVAGRLSSHREAFVLYRRAIHNMPSDLPLAEQARLLEAFSGEAAAIEELDACEWAAEAARERYARAGDPVGAADQLAVLAGMSRRRARPVAQRLATIQSAVAEVDGLPSDPKTSLMRGQLCMELVRVAVEALDLDTARAALEAGRRAAHEADDEATLLQANSLEGMIEAIGGHVADGLDQMSAAALAARERGFEDTGVTAYRDAAVVAARVLDYHRAAAWIDEGLRYADAIEQSHCAHIMASTGALVAWANGRWDEAVGRGEHALADRGCARAAGMARWSLGYAALGRGDLDGASGHLRVALEFGEVSGAPDFLLAALWGLAEASVLAGEHGDAIARADRALEIAQRTGERAQFAPFAVTGTRARIAAGRPADAQRWLSQVTEQLGPVEWFASPALDHATGLVNLAGGSIGVARTSLERAVRGWDSRGRTWEALWARLDLAACLLRSSRFIDATALLADVRARAQRLDSRPLLERVDQLSRLAHGHASEVESWRPLTSREFEVAQLIAVGRTNAAIAAELYVSPKTVSAHVEHVLAKLGASRRTEIAAWVAAIPGRTGQPGVEPLPASEIPVAVVPTPTVRTA